MAFSFGDGSQGAVFFHPDQAVARHGFQGASPVVGLAVGQIGPFADGLLLSTHSHIIDS